MGLPMLTVFVGTDCATREAGCREEFRFIVCVNMAVAPKDLVVNRYRWKRRKNSNNPIGLFGPGNTDGARHYLILHLGA
jgi:hypothetical protein